MQVITPGCSSSDSSADPQLSKAQKSPVGERAGPLSVGPLRFAIGWILSTFELELIRLLRACCSQGL